MRQWVTNAFGRIPKKELGPQNYTNLDRLGKRDTPACGTMPFAGNENEMLVMQSFSDSNILQLTWCLPIESKRFEKKSLQLIANLLKHQSDGSLYQCLKSSNLISDLNFNLNPEIIQSFRYLSLEI